MHTVAVLALDSVVPFDLATPLEVFNQTRLPDGRSAYRVRICAPTPTIDASGSFAIQAHWGIEALADADTVVIPGLSEPIVTPVPPEVINALRSAATRGTRIASICTGAFVLASTGLLDGLRATTHWVLTDELAARYPAIDVDPGVLYVDNDQFLTSAGAAAGLDLCLHMIRRDYGSAVAASTARMSVVPLEREGGQSQFIVHDRPPTPSGSALEPVLRWLQENFDSDVTLDEMARQAGMSTRTLNRRFREQMGTSPLQWLLRTRIRHAQHMLEVTDHPIDRVSEKVGFTSSAAFRERFKRIVGTTPLAYRAAFSSSPAPAPDRPARSPSNVQSSTRRAHVTDNQALSSPAEDD